jgi:hypothetical protein
MPNEEGSHFIVDLGKIKLPRLVEKQVEAEIQAAVLHALAESDFSGSQHARIPNQIRDLFPGQTLGLWIGDPNKPPSISGNGGSTSLTVSDHTVIIRAIMEHPFAVLRHLPAKYRSKTGGRPSGEEVLRAALQIDINEYVKNLIRTVLDLWPKIEEAQAALPASRKRVVEELRQQLANKTPEEQRNVLRDADLRSRHREDGLAEGMEVAAQMLEDGRDSIYSPDHSFYKLLQDGQAAIRTAARDALSDIGSADTVGATAGGAVGSVAAGVGAGPGAVAGGTVASAGAIGYHIGSWIRGLFD